MDLVDHGARPTYLTTSEVAEHLPAARVMEKILETQQAEIGVHFHTWTRKWPFPVADLGNPTLHAMAHQLGQDTEERMLDYTCTALENAFGIRPRSYRGGRWSLNGQTLKSLRNCGIWIDTTVTPGLNWTDERHPWLSGPDYEQAERHPHFFSGVKLDPQTEGDILELPVGACFMPSRSVALSRRLKHRVVRKLANTMGKPMGVIWLRPTLMSAKQLRICLEDLKSSEISVWVAMIHSSEISPSFHFTDEPAVREFRERCVQLVDDAVELGGRGATISEVWQTYLKTTNDKQLNDNS